MSRLWGRGSFFPLASGRLYTYDLDIFFLRSKAKAFESFMKFQALVEYESWKKIKILLLDKGGEFLLLEFNDHCDRVGIQ